MTARPVLVQTEAGDIDITAEVAVLYDTATNSMNWGSGFLDTDEVAKIRALAKACGFADVDYPLDRCTHCDHPPGSHYDPRAGGTRRPCRQSSWPERVPCGCADYERRVDA